MKRIVIAILGGLLIGAFAASHAKLPAPAPKSDAEKKADADKAGAAKAKDAELLDKARDRVVANYKKNKGIAMDAKPMPAKMPAKKK